MLLSFPSPKTFVSLHDEEVHSWTGKFNNVCGITDHCQRGRASLYLLQIQLSGFQMGQPDSQKLKDGDQLRNWPSDGPIQIGYQTHEWP